MHTLANDRVSLSFDEYGRLTELRNAVSGHRVPIDPAGLTAPFEIQLRAPDGAVTAVTPAGPAAMQVTRAAGEQILSTRWEVAGPWGALTVRGRVRLPDGDPLSYWSVEVDNRTALAIFQVAYPRVSGLTDYDRPTPGFLTAPIVMGEQTPDPVSFVNQHEVVISNWSRHQFGAFDTEGKPADIAYAYPGYWSMQFLTFGHPDLGGLYFGAYDAAALYKCFGLYQDGSDGKHAVLQVKQYPYDRTAAGANFQSFYECPVGVYAGEWWNASAIYREWALRQFWCRKGRTADREDVASWVKELDLWYWNWQFNTQGHPDHVVPIIRAIQARYGCTIAFHWYGFNGQIFGGRWCCPLVYPHSPDIRAALCRGVADLHRLGAHCIYYLETRLVNPEVLAFQRHDGMRWICVNEKGESADPWRNLGHTMCPTAPFFHTLICDENNRMITDCDMDGAYFDQVTGCYPAVCFNPDHGHGVGGHDHWVRGYRDLMTRARAEMRARKPDTASTSEGVAECFLDLFDADLSRDIANIEGHVGSERSLPVPMFHSVYHDYHISYGTVSTFKPRTASQVVYPDKFRFAEALCLVGGGQLMISGPMAGDDQKPAFQPFFDYMGTLVGARKAGRAFFNLGRWRPPLAIVCERVEVTVASNRPPKQGVPAVLSGCFELDGEVCAAVVNHTDREQKAALELRPGTLDAAAGPVIWARVYPEPREAGKGSRLETVVPPMSAQVYRFRPA